MMATLAASYSYAAGVASFDTLHPTIRRFHFGEDSIVAEGTFAVRRGRNPLSRIVAAVLRFPRDGRSVPITLRIERDREREIWCRSFEGRVIEAPFRVDGAAAVEQIGPFELTYAVSIERGALRMRTRGAALRAGRFRVALPRMLAPRISSRTWMLPGETKMRACVVVFIPFGGLLLAYRGSVTEV